MLNMLLQDKSSASQIEIEDLETLFNPLRNEIEGRIQEGQEEQDPQVFAKQDLTFASGEDLPRCWIDPNYRN
ncbi:acetyltransferase [Chamaesiphon sp. VAR_69_metabat_338]|uniref:acetyltransferase n=1 Tax=Chamaesiphon sp. VAR_69_metabat_338 TaxID=2964704 RepID=UPI00286E7BB4|nr:acetyltransferase [Chamaesiphon sp. VAR_69_metabat_338]